MTPHVVLLLETLDDANEGVDAAWLANALCKIIAKV